MLRAVTLRVGKLDHWRDRKDPQTQDVKQIRAKALRRGEQLCCYCCVRFHFGSTLKEGILSKYCSTQRQEVKQNATVVSLSKLANFCRCFRSLNLNVIQLISPITLTGPRNSLESVNAWTTDWRMDRQTKKTAYITSFGWNGRNLSVHTCNNYIISVTLAS